MFGTNEKTKQLRQKITQLSKINPNTYISKEELQQKKKKLCKNEKYILNPHQPPNQKGFHMRHPSKDIKYNMPKRVFAFDTNYYKTLHSEYNSIASSVNNDTNVEPSKLNRKQVHSQKQDINNSPIKHLTQMDVQKPDLIQLVPVRNQRQTIEEEKPIIQQKQVSKDIHQSAIPANVENIDKNIIPFGQNMEKQIKQQIFNIFSKETESKPSIPSLNQTVTKNPLLDKPTLPTLSANFFGKTQNSFFSNTPNKFEPAQNTFMPQTSAKPFGSFYLKQQSNKKQTQKPTLNIVEQQKHSHLISPAQTKKEETQSLFGKSSEGLFNANNKPGLFSSNNLFQVNKIQPKKEISHTLPLPTLQQNDVKPSLSFFNPKPIQPQAKKEVASKLFDGSLVSSQPGSLFNKGSISANTTLFPSLGNNTVSLFTSNNHITANKPLQAPVLAKPENEPKPQEKKIQVPITTEPEKKVNDVPPVPPKIELKPSPLNLFQNNKDGSPKQMPSLFASNNNSLFGSAPKPISFANNFFQAPQTQEAKKEQIPKIIQIVQSKVQQQQPILKPAVQDKKPEKEQKKGKAIGPGGQTIQLPILFGEKSKNLFQTTLASNFFTNSGNSSLNPKSDLPTQPLTSLFSQHGGTSLFGNSTNKLFDSSIEQPKTLFSNSDSALFSKEKVVEVDDEENEDQDDDGPIEAKDDGNPELCVIKYDYIQTNIFFKEPANKFREGIKDTLDSTIISIEKFQNSENRYLYVRMPNKCITFCGKFLKKITEVRVLNNNKKNIEIKKIMLSGQNVTSVELVLVKIQFKDEAVGQKFLKEVQNAIKEESA